MRIALLAVFALASSAGPAYAEPRWLSAQELGPASTAEFPDVAMNQSGDAAAVWVSGGIVNAAVRPAGAASFTPAETLSAPGQNATNMHVAIDGSGTATAVWQYPGATHTVQVATRPAGAAAFLPKQDVSTLGQDSRRPQVATDPAGNTIVIWVKGDDQVEAASRAAGASAFAGPFPVSPASGAARNPQVAMDAAGNAVVSWTDTAKRVWANARRAGASFPGASFSGPTLVSPSQPGSGASNVQVAMNPAGDATAVWQRTIDATQALVHSATSIGGVTFASEVLAAPTGQNLDKPQIGLDQSGNAVATWQRVNGPGSYSVSSSLRIGFGGAFTSRLDLPAAGPVPQEPLPQVAMSSTGNAIVAWRGHNGSNTIVQAATLASGGAFTSAATLSGVGFDARAPQVAIDSDGDGVAAWVRNGVAQAAGFDAAGPQLRGFSGPASAVAEDVTAWSVSPLDVWSGAGSTVWSFGDGATAGGASAVHAYAAAGTYTVTVTSTDTIGNSSSASSVITISPKPVPPPPPPTDTDGDGFALGVDCNDSTAAIHPGAPDKPGNKIDENCDGRDAAYPLLQSEITLRTQRVRGSRNLKLAALTIRPAVAGSTLRLRCTGGTVGCQRFKTTTRTITRNARVRTFSQLLPKRKLLPGARFEVRVTKPATIGRVLVLAVFARTTATRTYLCLAPGAKKPAVCPT